MSATLPMLDRTLDRLPRRLRNLPTPWGPRDIVHAGGALRIPMDRLRVPLLSSETSGFTMEFLLADADDEGLATKIKRAERAAEDGHPLEPWVERARQLQRARFALRLRYGARHRHGRVPVGGGMRVEGGTDVYDRYVRLEEPPSYELAAAIDKAHAERGERHVLRWPGAA